MHEREIDEKVATWLEGVADRGAISRGAARELESHLYDGIEEGSAAGLDEKEAFESAVAQLGDPAEIEKEFAKVYPEVSWARRCLWLAAGYAVVGLVLKLSVWAYMIAESLVRAVFPSSVVHLNHTVTIENAREDIFLQPFDRDVVAFDYLHTSTVAGEVARFGVLLVFLGLVAFVLRRRPDRVRKVLYDRRKITVLTLVGIGLQYLLSLHWTSLMWHRLWRRLWPQAENYDAFIDVEAQRVAGYGWLAEPMFWMQGVILIGAAFWLLRIAGRRSVEHGATGWVFAGYFAIAGLGHVLAAMGLLIALLVTTLVPSLAEGTVKMDWFYYAFYVGTPGGVVNLFAQVTLFAALLVALYVLLGKKRSSGLSVRIGRRPSWLLAAWILLIALPWLIVMRHSATLSEHWRQFAAFAKVPRGIWIAAFIVFVTAAWGWRHSANTQRDDRALT